MFWVWECVLEMIVDGWGQQVNAFLDTKPEQIQVQSDEILGSQIFQIANTVRCPLNKRHVPLYMGSHVHSFAHNFYYVMSP